MNAQAIDRTPLLRVREIEPSRRHHLTSCIISCMPCSHAQAQAWARPLTPFYS